MHFCTETLSVKGCTVGVMEGGSGWEIGTIGEKYKSITFPHQIMDKIAGPIGLLKM